MLGKEVLPRRKTTLFVYTRSTVDTHSYSVRCISYPERKEMYTHNVQYSVMIDGPNIPNSRGPKACGSSLSRDYFRSNLADSASPSDVSPEKRVSTVESARPRETNQRKPSQAPCLTQISWNLLLTVGTQKRGWLGAGRTCEQCAPPLRVPRFCLLSRDCCVWRKTLPVGA